MKSPSADTVINWAMALVVGIAATITFAYGEFETKEHSKERADMIIQRLDRIETKLDQALERK